jgi:energy-coupling factor transport system permease protein
VEDLELMRHITIGQYVPTGSPVHQRDPRVKILGLGLLIVAVVISPSVVGLVVALLLVIGLVLLSRVPLGFASGGLQPALPFILVIAVLQLLFGWGSQAGAGCQTLWSAGAWVNLTTCSLLAVIAMLLRLVCMIMLVGLLTMTSTLSELTHGIESLLRPLQKIGLPTHELALVLTISLRFVPTLAEELEKLLKAQVARGANIRMGSNPVQRTRHILPVLVPMFLTTLRRADMLGEAMAARGYNGSSGRSHYIQLHFNALDTVSLLACIAVFAGLLFLPFPVLDRAITGLLTLAAR